MNENIKYSNVVDKFFGDDVFKHPVLVDIVEQINFVHESSLSGVNFSLLVTGISRLGKSFVARRYETIHPEFTLDGVIQLPVLYTKIRGAKSTVDLLNQIIESLNAPLIRSQTKAHTIQKRLTGLLKEHGVQIVFIDEVQDCLPLSDGKLAQDMAKQLCRLHDDTETPFVLLGTPSAKRLINLGFGNTKSNTLITKTEEEQVSGRMLAPLSLVPIFPQTKSWVNCVTFFLNKYNLSLDIINSKPLLNRIYVATEGRLGFLNKLMFTLSRKNFETSSTLLKFQRTYKIAFDPGPRNPFDEKKFSDNTIHNMTIDMEPSSDDLIC